MIEHNLFTKQWLEDVCRHIADGASVGEAKIKADVKQMVRQRSTSRR